MEQGAMTARRVLPSGEYPTSDIHLRNRHEYSVEQSSHFLRN